VTGEGVKERYIHKRKTKKMGINEAGKNKDRSYIKGGISAKEENK
jgi:hypothetical protein